MVEVVAILVTIVFFVISYYLGKYIIGVHDTGTTLDKIGAMCLGILIIILVTMIFIAIIFFTNCLIN